MEEGNNQITHEIIGAAITVHRELGPGLLESAYQACLAYELRARSLNFEQQVQIPLLYRGVEVGRGYRADLVVERQVLVEIKAVEKLDTVHTAQLIAYLKLAKCPVGLLMNLNVTWLTREGLKRFVI